MHICQLRIEDFSGIKRAEFSLSKECVLLGSNNCGKTAVAEALALLLGRESVVRGLTEFDFFGGNPRHNDRFKISGVITGFPTNDSSSLPLWFSMNQGGIPVWWNSEDEHISYELEHPANSTLAVQISFMGRYNADECEVECRRYFENGDLDPFVDSPVLFSTDLLREVGLFILPSSRNWERMLSFGSSTFRKLLLMNDAMPTEALTSIRKELAELETRVEDSSRLSDVLQFLEKELKEFLLIDQQQRIGFRVTSLERESILGSLTPFITSISGYNIPAARQGSGFLCLQVFLILIAFARRRKELHRNFILVAEEPESHLHPSLQSRLIHRIRSYSDQCIITTHSPQVASLFKPRQAAYLANPDGNLSAQIIYNDNLSDSSLPNQVRQLFLRERQQFYQALLGKAVIVPEGRWDSQWLTLWLRIAETHLAATDEPNEISPSAISIVPSGGGSEIVETVKELARFRSDLVAIVDGDSAGNDYCKRLNDLEEGFKPKFIVQFPADAEIEDLVAWILEPLIAKPGPHLKTVLEGISGAKNVATFAAQLKRNESKGVRHKEDQELHENLAWEAITNYISAERARVFICDLAVIALGGTPNNERWTRDTSSNITKYVAVLRSQS
jgi:energy-coupling factor transporter ATP-binding protein EcfA2